MTELCRNRDSSFRKSISPWTSVFYYCLSGFKNFKNLKLYSLNGFPILNFKTFKFFLYSPIYIWRNCPAICAKKKSKNRKKIWSQVKKINLIIRMNFEINNSRKKLTDIGSSFVGYLLELLILSENKVLKRYKKRSKISVLKLVINIFRNFVDEKD